LTLAPLGFAFALSSLSGRRLAARFGGAVLTVGTIISASGLVVLTLVIATAGLASGIAQLVPGLVLIGLGNGLVIPILIGTVLAGVPVDSSGSVAGILTTTQQLSLALGIALIGLLFFSRTATAGIAAATTASLLCDLGLVLVAAALSLTLRRPRSVPTPITSHVEAAEQVAA
jgi:MFS family permease